MRSKLVFIIAAVGLLLGLGAAWYFSLKQPPQPPAFTPASNPYAKGIYADGIVAVSYTHLTLPTNREV